MFSCLIFLLIAASINANPVVNKFNDKMMSNPEFFEGDIAGIDVRVNKLFLKNF